MAMVVEPVKHFNTKAEKIQDAMKVKYNWHKLKDNDTVSANLYFPGARNKVFSFSLSFTLWSMEVNYRFSMETVPYLKKNCT